MFAAVPARCSTRSAWREWVTVPTAAGHMPLRAARAPPHAITCNRWCRGTRSRGRWRPLLKRVALFAVEGSRGALPDVGPAGQSSWRTGEPSHAPPAGSWSARAIPHATAAASRSIGSGHAPVLCATGQLVLTTRPVNAVPSSTTAVLSAGPNCQTVPRSAGPAALPSSSYDAIRHVADIQLLVQLFIPGMFSDNAGPTGNYYIIIYYILEQYALYIA